MSKPLNVAIAGLGTVGVGVVKIIENHADLLTARSGRNIRIVAVCARTRNKNRDIDLSEYDWEDDPVAMAKRGDVDLFIEVIGGKEGPAKAATEAALLAGKHVVTANKAMLAHHGQALATLAEDNNAALRFEAGIAGGIPIVKALTEGLAGNKITRIMGVMNGTCNYILTEMETSGADYDDVLQDAQHLGYAEADPSFDVGGIDAAHKLAVLASIAFGTQVDFDGVKVEGIDRITLTDIEQAKDMGYQIKLLGVARMNDDGLEQRMQPCLVPATSPLGQLGGVSNMVVVDGDAVNQIVLQGPGAGEGPTASAIMGDVMDIARGFALPVFGQKADTLVKAPRSSSGVDAEYYLRFSLADEPGTLASIATILGEHGVSINRMHQYGHKTVAAPVLIVTHKVSRKKLDKALNAIEAMDISLATPIALRIETV